MSETLAGPSPEDLEATLLRKAVERGWLTPEQVQEATLARLEAPEKTLLSHVPLTDEQRTQLAAELPESDRQTLRAPSTPATAPTRPGTPPEVAEALQDPTRRVGRYQVVKHLKSGGMGMVFKAWDPELSRWAALKVMKVQGDATATAYFDREARLAASLAHPNIAAIYEVGRHEGMPFIAMQFVDGPNLAEARKDLPRERIVQLIRDVALAVHAAHQAGIVHRDLKPANLMIDSQGRVYVMDFGLAKQADLTGMTSAQLSVSGTVLGTPAYMPPEQARGDIKSVDALSDVYSLGATLYDLFCFRPPFKSDSPAEVLVQVLNEEPVPPEKLSPGLPEDLATITMKCLEKDKSRRYASAKELADDLDRFARGEAILAHPPSAMYRLRKRVGRNPAAYASAAALALLVLGLLGYFLGPSWVSVVAPDGSESVRSCWPAGEHELRAEWGEHDAASSKVNTRPWRTTRWTPAWVKSDGFLAVETTPPGAEVVVVVNGTPRPPERANGAPIRVPKGTHEVRLRSPDHEEVSAAVFVPPGGTAQLVRSLVHDMGHLSVESAPEGVSLRVAGTIVSLPVERLRLPTGRHVLKFEKDNHFARTTEVVIRKETPAKVLIPPPPDGSGVIWRRDPGVTHVYASLNRMETWSRETTPFPVQRLLVADLDEDGVDDAVAVDSWKSIHALSGRDGTLLWSREWPLDPARILLDKAAEPRMAGLLADLDKDAVPDVVVATAEGWVRVLSGRHGATIWELKPGGTRIGTPAVADVDGDRVPDVVVSSDDGKVRALSGRGGALLWEGPPDLGAADAVSLGDLNGDEVPDATYGTRDGRVIALSGRNGKLLWSASIPGIACAAPALADLDGDRLAEVIVGAMSGHVVALSGIDGHQVWIFRTEGVVRSTPATAYLDGDPVPDVVVGSGDGGVYAASGRDGTWIWVRELPGPIRESPAAADLDGDGLHDIVVPAADGSLRALSGEDGGVLWVFRPEDPVCTSAALADLDGDGRPDGVVGTRSGKIHAFLGRDSAVTWYRSREADQHLVPPAAELDGDGVADLLVPSADWKLTAFSGASGAILWIYQSAGSIQGVETTADLDRDGTPDVLVHLVVGDTQALSGTSGERLWTAGAWRPYPREAAVDRDGDGIPDFLAAGEPGVEGISGASGRRFPLVECGEAIRAVLGAAVKGGFLVLSYNGAAVLLLDGTNGRALWRKDLPARIQAGRAWELDLDGDGTADWLVAGSNGSLQAYSGVEGRLLWGRGGSKEEVDVPWVEVADLDRDGKPDVIVLSRSMGPFALRGVDGRELWSLKVDSSTTVPVVRDLEGKGVPGVLLGNGSGFTIGYSGTSASPVLWLPRTGLLAIHGRQALFRSNQKLSVEEFRVPQIALGFLVKAGLWGAVESRIINERSVGEPDSAQKRYWSGVASLRRRSAEGAASEFAAARKLGLDSPELRADEVEAALIARRPLPSLDLPPAAVARLLDGHLPPEDLLKLADAASRGDSLGELILSFRGEAALARLPARDSSSSDSHLWRGLAWYGTPDATKARAELDRATRLFPYDRVVRDLAGRLAGWKGEHPLFGKVDEALAKRDFAGAESECGRLITQAPGLVAAYGRRAQARFRAGNDAGALEDCGAFIARGGIDARVLLLRGRLLLGKGQPDDALRDLDRAVELDPENEQPWYWRGRARHQKKDYVGAVADYTRGLQLAPKDTGLYQARADSHRLGGNREAALADFGRVLELDPKYSAAWNNRAIVRSETGDHAGAVADYTKAIECSGGKWAVQYGNRADSRYALKDYRGAAEDYSKALEIDPSHTEYWNDRGRCREELGDLPGAEADYSKAIEVSKGRYPVQYSNRGRVRRVRKNLEGALADFDKALELSKSRPETWNERGLVRFQQGEFAKAAEDFGRAIDLAPANATYWGNRAQSRYEANQFAGAVEDFARAIELQPAVPRHRLGRGWARVNLGEYPAAAEDADAVLKADPGLAEAYFLRGVVRRLQERWDEAIADLDASIKIDDQVAGAFNNRGLAKHGKGDPAGALPDMDRALALVPEAPVFLKNRGVVKKQLGDLEGAKADLDRSLDLDAAPGDTWYQRAELQVLRGDPRAAIEDYSKAVDRLPKAPLPLCRRGAARAAAGDFDGAIADLTRGLELASSDWAQRGKFEADLEKYKAERRKREAK